MIIWDHSSDDTCGILKLCIEIVGEFAKFAGLSEKRDATALRQQK